ncbi:hypothetical protein [Paracoccus indicus]|uniref:hypothetical protein n=1 Tax=Paracoccus indicus TaxID=2079229 RepID=UPI000D369BD9|nr:hypothetical protein [Paracoccus indicus]
MTDRRKDKSAPESRDDRLRQALRANLARRKAQARARADDSEPDNKAAIETADKTGKDDS